MKDKLKENVLLWWKKLLNKNKKILIYDEETIIYANTFLNLNDNLQAEVDKLVANFAKEEPEKFNKICDLLTQNQSELNFIENHNQPSYTGSCNLLKM